VQAPSLQMPVPDMPVPTLRMAENVG
jgi:hypothetical protein